MCSSAAMCFSSHLTVSPGARRPHAGRECATQRPIRAPILPMPVIPSSFRGALRDLARHVGNGQSQHPHSSSCKLSDASFRTKKTAIAGRGRTALAPFPDYQQATGIASQDLEGLSCRSIIYGDISNDLFNTLFCGERFLYGAIGEQTVMRASVVLHQ
jgi:hypothetical protein